MNNLTYLKNQLTAAGHSIHRFIGWQLETDHGTFTLYDETVFLNSTMLSDKEVKEIVSGKPQTKKSKESKSRVSTLQTVQSKRSKETSSRKSGSGKAK